MYHAFEMLLQFLLIHKNYGKVYEKLFNIKLDSDLIHIFNPSWLGDSIFLQNDQYEKKWVYLEGKWGD